MALTAHSSLSYDMLDHQASSLRCFNCGLIHKGLPSSHHPDCFFITIRRSGRQRLSIPSTHGTSFRSIPIPTDSSKRIQLRDWIWDEFEGLMDENRRDRERVAVRQKTKGQLRTDAPLPWLSWTGPDGERGQTRNKENFMAIWDRVVESESFSGRRTWLSSVLLPGDPVDHDQEDISVLKTAADYAPLYSFALCSGKSTW